MTFDALEKLKDLSEALQNRDIRLSEAMKKIKRQADIFSAMKETNGPHYELACQAVEEDVFKGVTVRTGGRQTMIPPQKFFDALSNSMLSRKTTEEEIELYEQLNVLKPGLLLYPCSLENWN